jgi:methylglutaconyl-CoA hydratase
MENGSITQTIVNNVCTITFYHPKGNSMPSGLLSDLAKAIKDAGKNDNIKAIILQSTGKSAFCAGASFDELIEINNFADGTKFFSGFANVINNIRKCPKFVIGRIHSKVIGGGIGLVAACDYTYAVESVTIRLSEFNVGIGPFVIAPAIVRKIGESAFSQMTIDTEWYTAKWAQDKGLFNRVFQTTEEMDIEISKLAEKLTLSSMDAMYELKKLFWDGTENWDELLIEKAKVSGKLVLTDYTKNYLKNFKK